MGSGMSKVVAGLYLGNIRDSEDRDSLRRHGVTHILSVHNGAKPVLEDMTYLCISASDSSSQNLMQHFKESIKFIHECRLRGGGCLVHCPNFGFQQQLQEYEQTLLKEYRAWIRHDYGRNPFQDQEELQRLLAQQEQSGSREGSCTSPPAPNHPLPSSRSPWMDR
ncbi:dual specificity protein phosphatase 22-A-like isoform X8 [Lagopus muta]|uniref:dual specificity protein phosphatase 22-A-like isoform X8 n=1 Tax=Lagopus muta TaxID=64668 RepID=UPI00209DD24A|nr:dual specificity protein phosphatase 22-A-like isoform X8 [Lagopus muta]